MECVRCQSTILKMTSSEHAHWLQVYIFKYKPCKRFIYKIKKLTCAIENAWAMYLIIIIYYNTVVYVTNSPATKTQKIRC